MEVTGTVVRLQLQRSRLKPGERGARRYTTEPLAEVGALRVGPLGCTGPDGTLDVHHADHPDSRNRRLANGLSLMTTAAYAVLRARYGPHLADGVAGENLLVDGALSDGLSVEVADGGLLALGRLEPVPPCVEFSRWVLGRDDLETDDEVLAALESLGGGARGWYAPLAAEGVVARGARLLRR